ncbi:MAG: hypothetical protein QF464_14080, partial [Myxococcota bacterium]|nr:hypothetical protein [Myxococcota bacterium]
ECMLVLLENGTMPSESGCTGEPVLDVGKPGCLSGNELAHIESWLDAGAGCGPDGVPCDFGDTCVLDGVCDNGECLGTSPCQNGGLCAVDGDLFTCQCPPGFGGLRCETNIDECADTTVVGPTDLPNTGDNALADIILIHDPATRVGCVIGVEFILANSPVGNGLGWAVHVYDLVGTTATLQAIGAVDIDPGQTGAAQTAALAECLPIEVGQYVALMNPEGDTEIALSSEGGGYLFLDQPAKSEIDGPAEVFEQSNGGAAVRVLLGHEAPCKNGATCEDDVATFSCTCADGYGGVTCALDLDECDPNPCQSGGVCVDAVDGFACECPIGFDGTLCEVDFDDCSLSLPYGPSEFADDGASSAHLIVLPQAAAADGCVTAVTLDLAAVPEDVGGSWEVRVYDVLFGFATLQSTASINTNTNTMTPQTIGVSPCLPITEGQHVGVYHDAGPTRLSFSAEPGSGYLYLTTPPGDVVGETTTLNAWSGSPGFRAYVEVPVCENDSTCTDGVDGFTCECLAGYEGETCETDTDDCAEPVCLNSSTCVDLVDGFACECAIGFTGETCETNIDNCSFEPCENGASCADGVDDYVCTCLAGYT